eukprot:scaffold19651_cov39-Tisochrysis_lutea.AAC.1
MGTIDRNNKQQRGKRWTIDGTRGIRTPTLHSLIALSSGPRAHGARLDLLSEGLRGSQRAIQASSSGRQWRLGHWGSALSPWLLLPLPSVPRRSWVPPFIYQLKRGSVILASPIRGPTISALSLSPSLSLSALSSSSRWGACAWRAPRPALRGPEGPPNGQGRGAQGAQWRWRLGQGACPMCHVRDGQT